MADYWIARVFTKIDSSWRGLTIVSFPFKRSVRLSLSRFFSLTALITRCFEKVNIFFSKRPFFTGNNVLYYQMAGKFFPGLIGAKIRVSEEKR